MNNKEIKITLATGPVIFILCCAVVTLFVLPQIIHRYGYHSLLEAYGLQCGVIGGCLWIFHFILLRRFFLQSINAWFCSTFSMLLGIFFAYILYRMFYKGIYDSAFPLMAVWGIVFCGSMAYCFKSEFNWWISFLMVLLLFAEAGYPLCFEEPEKCGWLYYACNGLRVFVMVLAIGRTVDDAKTTIRITTEENRKKREQQEAERMAQRRAERLEKLPREIDEMQPYSLNILPFISAMSCIGSDNVEYSRTCEKLRMFAMQVEQKGRRMNEEASELGLGIRTNVHSK